MPIETPPSLVLEFAPNPSRLSEFAAAYVGPAGPAGPAGPTGPAGTVAEVTATAPVVSSGGATPVISMPAATPVADGYMTSADKTTVDNLGGMAFQNPDSVVLEGSPTLPKTSGVGIKLDPLDPTFGWRDITAPVDVRGFGGNDPDFVVYGATSIRQYSFSASADKEVFLVFHIPHDWVFGTAIHFHAHWSNAAAVPNTGNVVWGFDYSFAKGFDQDSFPAVTSVTVTQASSSIRYRHMIAETEAVTIPGLEVDGLILVRGYRKASDPADTCTDAVFLHTMDIHYQSSNVATKNKAPNFYG